MEKNYTRKVFYKFQDELMMIMNYQINLIKDDERESTSIVINMKFQNEIERCVILDKEKQTC